MRGSPVWTSRTMATWPGRTSSGRALSQQKVSVQELKVSFLRIPELAINPLGDRIVHAFFYESKSQGEEKVDFKVSSQVEIMWGGGWARKSDKKRSRQVFRRVQKNNVESGWRLGVTGTGHPKLKTSPDFTTTAPQPHQLPLTYTTTQLKPYFVPSWHWIQKIIPGIKSKYFCCAHHHDKIGPWIDLEAFLETPEVKFCWLAAFSFGNFIKMFSSHLHSFLSHKHICDIPWTKSRVHEFVDMFQLSFNQDLFAQKANLWLPRLTN